MLNRILGLYMSDAPSTVLGRELRLPEPLRSYQWDGVRFLSERHSALLADQMGLGKTVMVSTALSLLFHTLHANRALVVVPASLRLNWERELDRWAPALSVRRLRGDEDERLAYYRLPVNVLIASYEQVRTDALTISKEVYFDVVVLDEAQRIKNVNSTTALACRMLQRDRSWALSGTPIENSVDDLLSLYQFVYPGLLNAAMDRADLLCHVTPFYLRRRKDQVLQELPPIITQDVVLELGDRQREAYDRIWAARRACVPEGASEVQLFALITRLKQLCNYDPESGESAKLDELRVVTEGLTGAEDKIIVFSQYVETLHWIAANLASSMPCDVFHGGLSEGARDTMLANFRDEPGPRILLMSLRAAGVGLNIQEATVVLLFDRWWNPAVEAQAIHRAHRFGRDRPLHVLRFLVADSIEDRIAAILNRKIELFDTYIEAADVAAIPPLSRSDLLRILGLQGE